MSGFSDSYTFRLFKEGSRYPFVEGVGSILDFSDSEHLYNYDDTIKEADRNSLRADWLQVGKDLQRSIDEYATGTRA
jgi:hypothetical protein